MEESEFAGRCVREGKGITQPVGGWAGAWGPKKLDASGRGAENPVSERVRKMGKAHGPGAVMQGATGPSTA